ncbi:MAG: sugar phosphate isomerase/epimerase [Sphingomonadales bacterium]|nr:sugar phosphate isomerase/epimerase [Sphingomonadales bacterium]
MVDLGIERLSVFGMPPLDFIAMTARLGCQSLGLGLATTGGYNPHGYPEWSFRDDPQLLRDTRQSLLDHDVRLGLVEGFAVVPDQPVTRYAADLDLVAELGCERIAVVSLDKDLDRTIAGFAEFAELAAARGLAVSAELGSLGPIRTLAAAEAAVRGVNHPAFTLLLDTMHFFRLGSTNAQLAQTDLAAIGYVQLCDAPWQPRFATYIEEALYERLPPGAGELPLAAFLAQIPPHVPISLEIPRRSLAEAGVPPAERLAPCIAAARAMLDTR